ADPQPPGKLSLRAKAHARSSPVAKADTVEALLAKESPHGLRRNGTAFEPPIGCERPQDQGDGGRGMLAADLEEKRALLGRELAGTAAIAARLRPKRLEAAPPIG